MQSEVLRHLIWEWNRLLASRYSEIYSEACEFRVLQSLIDAKEDYLTDNERLPLGQNS